MRKTLGLREFKLAEINEFMESLPRDMLFVLRTSNLVRALNYDLGGRLLLPVLVGLSSFPALTLLPFCI